MQTFIKNYNSRNFISDIMTLWHLRSKRKISGGLYNRLKKKKRRERGNLFLETKIGKRDAKMKQCRGGKTILKLKSCNKINVAYKNKVKQAKIISVKENPANPHYVRRNILTKGAFVETDLGTVKITSRPGKVGMLNGVLIEEKK